MTQNLQQWNEFVVRNGGSFLQSWEWGEFQKQVRPIWRIGGDKWQALIISNALPFGMSYLYCPGGQVLDQEFFEEVRKIARKGKPVFFKIEPMTKHLPQELEALGFQKSHKEVQPQKTIILDLAKSEEELRSGMHPKARYNIGLAKKHGLSVRMSQHSSDIEIFLDLLEKTSTRDGFSSHPAQYYRNLLGKGRGTTAFAQLFLAERNGHILSANIVIFFGDTVTYLHGASDYDNRKYMAPYLLQWESILEAKRRGYQQYDFWGIDENKWSGVTRFKRGFGGREILYVGSYDYAYKSLLYNAYLLKQKYFRGRI